MLHPNPEPCTIEAWEKRSNGENALLVNPGVRNEGRVIHPEIPGFLNPWFRVPGFGFRVPD